MSPEKLCQFYPSMFVHGDKELSNNHNTGVRLGKKKKNELNCSPYPCKDMLNNGKNTVNKSMYSGKNTPN